MDKFDNSALPHTDAELIPSCSIKNITEALSYLVGTYHHYILVVNLVVFPYQSTIPVLFPIQKSQ